MNIYLQKADEYAKDYDREAFEQEYHGPEILFGLMFEYLRESDQMLDIGIGTGLNAALFQKAGAMVFGVDGSKEMLNICEKKGVAEELKQIDFLIEKIPYPDEFFNHAIANSIFHMLSNLSPVFTEVARLLKAGGIFAFSIDETSGSYAGIMDLCY